MDILKQFIGEPMNLLKATESNIVSTIYTIVYIAIKELTKYNQRRDRLLHKKLDKMNNKLNNVHTDMSKMENKFKKRLRRLLRGAYVKTHHVIECEATPEYKS
jgi:hypothetical protein